MPHDFGGRLSIDSQDCPAALDQARTENGVSQVGTSFLQALDGVVPRHRTATKTFELGKNEPHPVAFLPATHQLRKRPIKYSLLGTHEALQIESISPRVAGVRLHANC